MVNKKYRQARFLTSAANVEQLPPDIGAEVAFMGCSNVGKSTTLNAIADNKQLARTSKTPGRTQLMNVFVIDEQRRLIDLPGFGYAKVPEKIKDQWHEQLNTYLCVRRSLRGIILVTDIRHPFRPFEQHMIQWTQLSQLPLLILLNKADKLSKQAASLALASLNKQLPQNKHIHVQLFSAAKKMGLDSCYAVLDEWLEQTSS